MIKNLLQEGFVLKNRGHYKHAIEILYKALEQDNTSSELLYEIAETYKLMGNEEKALWYIQQVLKTDSLHVLSLKLLKNIFIEKKAFSEAEQTAWNIYEITKSDRDLYEYISLLNDDKKYEDVLKYDNENAPVYIKIEIAKSYYYQNNTEETIRLLKSCLEKEPENQEASLFLGRIYYDLNEFEQCYNIEKNLKEDDCNPEVLNFIGLLKSKKAEYEAASQYFLRATRLSPSENEYLFNLANNYYLAGQWKDAKKFYNLVLSRNPEDKQCRYALAKLYYMEKQYNRALEILPEDLFEARNLKAIILCETGYYSAARHEICDLLKQQPDNEKLLDCKNKIDKELGITVN